MARKKNYLNNKDLHAAMSESKELDKLTPQAEKMLVLLAERAILKMRYVNEDDKNDCLQFAMLDLLKYWRNFNPDYPNAFAYFTEIAKGKYIEFINRDENIDFGDKMTALQSEFSELLQSEQQSKADLLNVFKELGYEIEL